MRRAESDTWLDKWVMEGCILNPICQEKEGWQSVGPKSPPGSSRAKDF